jgi:hypothetical protein
MADTTTITIRYLDGRVEVREIKITRKKRFK